LQGGDQETTDNAEDEDVALHCDWRSVMESARQPRVGKKARSRSA
jgi:hypothetical protein